MRVTSVVAVVLLVPTLAPAQTRSGAYVARQATLEVTRETYQFDGQSLMAQVDIASRGLRLETETIYGPRLSPLRYRAKVTGASGGSTLQEIEAEFADSVRWTLRSGGATRRGATGITRPYAILQNLMFSQLAVALLRYERAAHGTQVVDLWLPEGARVAQLRMTFVGDSGEVELSGVTMFVKTDATGWLKSVTVPAQGLIVEWRDQPAASVSPRRGGADTLPPAGARESTTTFTSGTVRIEGTLTLPVRMSGRVPAVVIVAGSGPTDRNGNSPLSVHSNMYAQLAWRLAERGIASLRYDKRGIGASRGGVDFAAVTLDDFAGDAVAAVRALRADPRIGPVAIVGHSEGAWLAMRAANSGAPVAGIALLSGLGRPFGEAVGEQLDSQVDPATARRFAELFPKYLAGEDLGPVPDQLRPLFVPVNRVFMRTLAAFDARVELAKVNVPVLIVQGDQDIQVGVRDAQILKSAKPAAKLVVISGVNHLYKVAATRDRMVQLALYMDPALPIAPTLVNAVSDWMATLK